MIILLVQAAKRISLHPALFINTDDTKDLIVKKNGVDFKNLIIVYSKKYEGGVPL